MLQLARRRNLLIESLGTVSFAMRQAVGGCAVAIALTHCSSGSPALTPQPTPGPSAAPTSMMTSTPHSESLFGTHGNADGDSYGNAATRCGHAFRKRRPIRDRRLGDESSHYGVTGCSAAGIHTEPFVHGWCQ